MNKIKIMSTICLQNIVQTIIQCVYIATIHIITPNTAFAFVASFLSITGAMLSYYVQKESSNSTPVQYYLQLVPTKNTNESGDAIITDEERENIKRFRGIRKELKKKIAQACGANERSLEIGNIEITNIVNIHMVHYMDDSEMNELNQEEIEVNKAVNILFSATKNKLVEALR
eukprot:148726_1